MTFKEWFKENWIPIFGTIIIIGSLFLLYLGIDYVFEHIKDEGLKTIAEKIWYGVNNTK